jgi:pimeloyl-ACP methyl ester carboxylesterase
MMRNLLRSLVAVSLVVAGVGIPASASAAADKPWLCGASGGVGQRTVVLLVHGFNSEPKTWSEATAQYLASNPATCISTFDYKLSSTKWVTDPTIAHALGTTIRALASRSRDGHGSGKVVIVAHSMGGLATRCAATRACSGQDGVASDIQALITFGTPTLGSFLRDDGRSHVGNILGSLFSATCAISGLDTSLLKGLCRQVRALGTSDAAKAFTPGSAQLKAVSTDMPFPITAVAGSVKLQTSFFGQMRVVAGDAGDLVVDVQSALKAHHAVAGVGGQHVVDCGYLDISGIGAGIYGIPGVAAATAYGAAFSSLGCMHTSETNDNSFLLLALHEITQIEVAARAATLTNSAFVGDWYVHGGGMTIHSDGTAISSFKLYESCTRDGITECYGETSMTARLSPDGKTATLTIKNIRYVTYVGSTPHEVTNLEWKSGAPDWLKAGIIWRYQFTAPGIIKDLNGAAPNMCSAKAPVGACGA